MALLSSSRAVLFFLAISGSFTSMGVGANTGRPTKEIESCEARLKQIRTFSEQDKRSEPIETLLLSRREIKNFQDAGIRNFDDLTQHSFSELLQISKSIRTRIADVVQIPLARLGLRLKIEPPPPKPLPLAQKQSKKRLEPILSAESKISSLPLSRTEVSAFKKAGVKTVGDLIQLSYFEVLYPMGFNRARMATHITSVLQKNGLHLDNDWDGRLKKFAGLGRATQLLSPIRPLANSPIVNEIVRRSEVVTVQEFLDLKMEDPLLHKIKTFMTIDAATVVSEFEKMKKVLEKHLHTS